LLKKISVVQLFRPGGLVGSRWWSALGERDAEGRCLHPQLSLQHYDHVLQGLLLLYDDLSLFDIQYPGILQDSFHKLKADVVMHIF